MMPKKVLFICPPSTRDVYSKSKIKVAISNAPLLSLASLAATLLEAGHTVKISDLSKTKNPKNTLLKNLEEFKPDYVGLTFTTPLYKESMAIADLIKNYNKNIIVITGGVHSSAFPEEVIQNQNIDIVVIGEGDYTIVDIVSGKPSKEIDGIAFKENKTIIKTKLRKSIKELDKLPLPAWHLYNLKKYKTSKLYSRKNPIGPIMTGRGCPFNCKFCNKNIFGKKIRMKSVERVIEEIEHLLKSGFKEVHILDDTFNIDIKRVKKICDIIIEKKLKFPLNLANGIRVDLVDEELFSKLKKAGCYQIGIGIESGNQELLNNLNKGTNLEQIKNAVNIAKKQGIETIGFYMFALPGETIETMKKTIDFAIKLDTTYAKVTMTIPLPSTPLFNEIEKEGRIKTKNWENYNYHHTSEIYDHENLDWKTINKYYSLFYKKFYFRPKFIWNRIKKGVKNGGIFYDFYYFLEILRGYL